MNILHIYDEHYPVKPGYGSVSTAIYNIARESAVEHNVTVAERKWNGYQKNEKKEGVNFERFELHIGSSEPGEEIPHKEVKSKYGMLKLILDRMEFAVRLRSYIQDNKFEVIHIHLPFTANVLMYLCPRIRSKMVYTAHIGEEELRLDADNVSDYPSILQYFSPDLHLMRRVGITTVLNESVRQTVENKGIQNVEVVPNGVQLEKFNIKTDHKATTQNNIIFVGSITHRKGVDTLITASKILASDGIDHNIKLVGDTSVEPGYVKEIHDFIDKFDLGDYVQLTGYVSESELIELYNMSDIFVLPSREEGFGMVLTEAMATGLPVVGSDVGGIPRQISSGRNGYLIPPDNPKVLARKLKHILNNDDLKNKMGDESQEIVQTEFSWEKIASYYLDIYERYIL